MTASESTRAAIERDARDLKRGVGVNLVGYALKLANPVLLVFVTSAYGIERFGAYTIAQVAMLFAAKLGAAGLDKGLLWWVARQQPAHRRTHVRSAVALAAALTSVVAFVFFIGADPAVLERLGQPPELSTPLRIVALAMVPHVCADILAHAAMGLRRMEAHVVVRDGVVPIAFPVVALILFYAFDLAAIGLPLAFVVASLAGLGAALWMYRRLFAALPRRDAPGLPPRALLRYAVPMWLAEVSNSALLRIDVLLVEILTGNLALVGAYAVATRFSNALRQVRRSFDPIVVAIVSEIGARRDRQRLRAGFSYATFLVTLTQLPIFAVLFAYAGDITPLFGEGFEVATMPIVVLGGVWLVNGLISLSGIVVTAYGHSKQTLLNTLLACALLAGTGVLLVPHYDLLGAALAVGVAYTGQGIAQLIQMRIVTGGWNYDRSVLYPLGLGLLAGAAMAGGWLLVGKTAGVAAFALVYAAGVARLKRAGLLGRPRIARR